MIYQSHPTQKRVSTACFFLDDVKPLTGPAAQGFIPEPLLWSYIIQITSALRAVHANGIACRIVHPSKVLITGRNRIRLSSACVLDVLQYAEGQMSPAAISHYQQEDLLALGRLILALACSRLDAVTREAMPQSMQYIRSRYSEDVLLIIRYLLAPSPHGHLKNLNDLMPMIGSRFYTELESSSRQNITLEAELGKELQNGRLFRLMYVVVSNMHASTCAHRYFYMYLFIGPIVVLFSPGPIAFHLSFLSCLSLLSKYGHRVGIGIGMSNKQKQDKVADGDRPT